MKMSHKAKKVDTYVGGNSTFKGNIMSKASLIIEGAVEGEILADGEVLLGKTATVIGDITACSVTVSGSVKGNIKTMEYTKLTVGSNVEGDIYTRHFIADEGSVFNGKCYMNKNEEA